MISKSFTIVIVVCAVIAGLAGYVWKEMNRPPVLDVYVFDMKSGHSVFVRTPDDRRIVIDGGNGDIIAKLTGILPFYSRRIDDIVVTDEDDRDISGLVEVLNRYEVGKLFLPKYTPESVGMASSSGAAYVILLDIAADRGVEVITLSEGDTVSLGCGGFSGHATGESREDRPDYCDKPVEAHILFPASPEQFVYSKASPPMVVMRLSYGSNSFMLPGNTSPKIQKYIVDQNSLAGYLLKSDVLVMANSAGPSLLARSFTDLVHPSALVYSKSVSNSKDAKNQKTDPLYYLLDKYRFNTKEKGDIHIVSDGNSIDFGH